MNRPMPITFFLAALPLCLAVGCASEPSPRYGFVADPDLLPGRLGLTEAGPARMRWRDAGEPGMGGQPAHWSGSLIIRSLEPEPDLQDVLSDESPGAAGTLPEGVYTAEVAKPTQRYIEVLLVRDDTGRALVDAADGDGTLPRLDVMLSNRFHGHYLRRETTMGVGVRLDTENATKLSARGNIVIPRFNERREVLLPLDTLRAADMGTLSLGRGRSVRIGQSVERVRVGRGMEDQLVEQVTITVDLATNSTESFPIDMAVITESGDTLPVTRWHSSGSGGVGPKGWSVAMRPAESALMGDAVALRFTLADHIDFERRPFELADVPIEYTPRPEPKTTGG